MKLKPGSFKELTWKAIQDEVEQVAPDIHEAIESMKGVIDGEKRNTRRGSSPLPERFNGIESVLLMCGDKDRVVPYKTMRAWEKTLRSDFQLGGKRLQVVPIQNAGHVFHWEKAEETHEKVLSWLKK